MSLLTTVIQFVYLFIASGLINFGKCQFANQERLKTDIERYFSFPRSTESEKALTLNYINHTLNALNLRVKVHDLYSYNGQRGANVIATLPGIYYGTKLDKLIVVGAHYDTVPGSKGVNDNGSGVSAMLETARILASFADVCKTNYTTIFVAFDFEEIGYFGSSMFVDQWLALYLLQNPGTQFQGALILDTVMNYDDSMNSQTVSENFSRHFPDIIHVIDSNGRKGNFVQTVLRDSGDKILFETFRRAMIATKSKQHSTISPWLLPLEIPFSKINNLMDTWEYMHYVTSDHRSFWFNMGNITLPAIHISDSVQFRGKMQGCYHAACDNLSMLSAKNLEFLAFIVDSVVKTVSSLSESSCAAMLNNCPMKAFQPCPMCTLLLADRYQCSKGSDFRPFLKLKNDIPQQLFFQD